MLIEIPEAEHPRFFKELQQAAQSVFPGFGYQPERIARFLDLNSEPFEDTHYVLEEDGVVVAVAMRCGDLLEFVVPAIWERRYELVAQIVGAILEQKPELSIRIREDLPSHSSWYAALLPCLGFSMKPRFRMEVPVNSLLAIVPHDHRGADGLVPMEPRWVDACLALYSSASGLSDLDTAGMERILRESLEAPDRMSSWLVAFEGDEIVGSCFGSHHQGRLFVEELAVDASYRNQGLGRRLLLESVRRLASGFPDAEVAILDVTRINTPAVGLYSSLGFVIKDHYTVGFSAEV